MKRNTVALIDDTPALSLSYKEMKTEGDAIIENIEKRTVVLIICTNSLGAILGYKAFLDHRVVPLLLDEKTKKEILHTYIEKYVPSYLWIPDFYEQIEGYNDIIYQKYGYRLLRKNNIKGYKLYDELALLLTTSGTTGSIQLVRLSYQNVFNNAEMIAQYLNLNCSDKAITTLPLNYSYGLSIINSHLLVGASVLITRKKVFQKEFWDFFIKEGATNFGGVPSLYEMLDKIGFLESVLPSLKIMTQAGGKLSENLQEKFGRYAVKNNKKFFVMYGQTEATARISYLPSEFCLEKIGSIGCSIPGGKIELIDVNGKKINDPYCVGEIIYYGKNVMLGYACDKKDLQLGDELGGILKTGDLAKKDEDGFYYIVGRKKRFIKLHGMRISLDVVEECLEKHFQSMELACVGDDTGLYVFATGDIVETEVRNLLMDKMNIDPRDISFLHVEKIPRTSSGKKKYKALDALVNE